MPVYKDDDLPPANFFWFVLNTLNRDLAKTFIEHSEKLRRNDNIETVTVQIQEEVLNQIRLSKKLSSSKKGRALTMLGKKDLGSIQRKRKRKVYAPLNLKDNEEEKSHQSKRSKKTEEDVRPIEDMNVDQPLIRSYSDTQREIDNEYAEQYLADLAPENNSEE